MFPPTTSRRSARVATLGLWGRTGHGGGSARRAQLPRQPLTQRSRGNGAPQSHLAWPGCVNPPGCASAPRVTAFPRSGLAGARLVPHQHPHPPGQNGREVSRCFQNKRTPGKFPSWGAGQSAQSAAFAVLSAAFPQPANGGAGGCVSDGSKGLRVPGRRGYPGRREHSSLTRAAAAAVRLARNQAAHGEKPDSYGAEAVCAVLPLATSVRQERKKKKSWF